jgi:proteasome lid subunit RPN8/RPN11
MVHVKIRKKTLEFILEAASNTYPNEFIGLLRKQGEAISEVLVIPGSEFGRNMSVLRPHMVPLDPSIVGSVHSHPFGTSRPSKADLHFFGKQGAVHMIVTHPFTFKGVRFFNSQGEPTEFQIVEVGK